MCVCMYVCVYACVYVCLCVCRITNCCRPVRYGTFLTLGSSLTCVPYRTVRYITVPSRTNIVRPLALTF